MNDVAEAAPKRLHDFARRGRRRLLAAAAAALLPLATLLAPDAAGAAASATAYTCSGPSLPGGTYSSVRVTGVCSVNAGKVLVTGDVTIVPGGALIAAFARDDRTGAGASSIRVEGSVLAGRGTTVVLGCEPNFFTCADDPNQSSPTLRSSDEVDGSLVASSALGILMHASTVAGDIREGGGGGGVNCNPSGAFTIFHSPVYSDFEDNTIDGNLWVTRLSSCWLGALRDRVGGSIVFAHDVMADPDAMEVLADTIAGNLICEGNSPANQYGDSGSSPSIVSGSAVGQCAFSVLKPNPSPSGHLSHLAVPGSGRRGYALGGADGGVFTFGTKFLGSAPGTAELAPYVGVAMAPGGHGYWIAAGTGRVIGFGPNAAFFGDAQSTVLNAPVVAVASAPAGDGYWLASLDGGVFSYGPGARFFGSAAGSALTSPVAGIAAAPAGDGYFLAEVDGGVLAFGPGARDRGSLAGTQLNEPIVGIAVDPATGGYWLAGADGGVFSFGAPYFGSAAGLDLTEPIVGIAAAPTGDGYYLVGKDGGIFAFGRGAHYQGSTAGQPLNQPVEGMAVG